MRLLRFYFFLFLAFLGQNLCSSEQIEKLFAKLDDEDFSERENATKKLIEIFEKNYEQAQEKIPLTLTAQQKILLEKIIAETCCPKIIWKKEFPEDIIFFRFFDNVIILAAGKKIFFLDPQNGREIFSTGYEKKVFCSKESFGNRLFYFIDDKKLKEFDYGKKEFSWGFDVGSEVLAPVLVTGDILIVHSEASEEKGEAFIGISAKSREKKWEFPINCSKWLESEFSCTPILVEDTYVGGGKDGILWCNKIENSKTNWFFPADGAIISDPLFFKDLIFFSCTNGYIYALDYFNGKQKWKTKMGDPKKIDFLRTPFHGNDRIFLKVDFVGFRSIDIRNGNILNEYTGPSHSFAGWTFKDGVLLSSMGYLVFLSQIDLTEKNSFKIPESSFIIPHKQDLGVFEKNGLLYFSNQLKCLYCLKNFPR